MSKWLVICILVFVLFLGLFPETAFAAGKSAILKIGDQNDNVIKLQTRLKELGYLSGNITGYFGSITQQAIIDFQEDHNLAIDGKADPQILSMILGQSLAPQTENDSTVSKNEDTYYPGDKGAAIAALQQRLSDLEYYEYNSITGYYGPITKEAVKSFQKTNGLEVNGIAGPETLVLLNSGKALRDCLCTGDKGRNVKTLQQRLTTLGYFEKPANGYFGPSTETALSEFQAQNGLNTDGQLGRATRVKLYSDSASKWDGVKRISNAMVSTVTISIVDKLLDIANRQLGKEYAYANEGPASFDNSGLVYYVLRSMGVSIKRGTAASYSQTDRWEKITDIQALLPGDILFFSSNSGSTITHMGIFLGSNQFIHASASDGCVRISHLSGLYNSNFSFARRIF